MQSVFFVVLNKFTINNLLFLINFLFSLDFLNVKIYYKFSHLGSVLLYHILVFSHNLKEDMLYEQNDTNITFSSYFNDITIHFYEDIAFMESVGKNSALMLTRTTFLQYRFSIPLT